MLRSFWFLVLETNKYFFNVPRDRYCACLLRIVIPLDSHSTILRSLPICFEFVFAPCERVEQLIDVLFVDILYAEVINP